MRILIVEDFEPIRRFMVSMLQEIPEFQVVGEASDGFEAVRKTEELRPDLILLDIALPTLNGIEVARQVRKHAPNLKILFVSSYHSSDIISGALRTGACGYVLKSQLGRELLPAVQAVLRGEQFVSSTFADLVLASNAAEQTGGQLVADAAGTSRGGKWRYRRPTVDACPSANVSAWATRAPNSIVKRKTARILRM